MHKVLKCSRDCHRNSVRLGLFNFTDYGNEENFKEKICLI